MKVNGLTVKNMAVEIGNVLRDKATLENGNTVKQKDSEFIFPRMETDTKVNLRTLISKVLEHKDIIMVKHM